MNFTINTHRLLALYHSATPSQREEGLTWYNHAREFARAVAGEFNLTTKIVAAVIAVTSPRHGWGANKDTAYTLCSYHSLGLTFERACQDPLVRGFNANLVKAWRILGGENPDIVVSGPKVTAFYKNIQGDESVVTLDTHTLNAWLGSTSTTNYGACVRDQAGTDYTECADHVDISPSQFQAVVWVVWRSQIMSAAAVAHHDKSTVEQPVELS